MCFTDLPDMNNQPIKINRKLNFTSDKNKHAPRVHMLPPNIGKNWMWLQLHSAEMSEMNSSDNCRLCKVSFKVKFGNLGKQSHSLSENLFKPSKRQDCFGVRLSKICSQIRLPFVQDSLGFSDHVYNPCGQKICNLGQLYEFVKAANTSLTGTPIQKSKQTLTTPEKASPSWRKSI